MIKDISEFLNIKGSELLEKAEASKEDLIFEAEVFYGGDVDLKKDAEELLLNFKEEHLKEGLLQKMRELQDFEEKKDSKGSNRVLQEVNEINKKIQDIKNLRK